MLLFYMAIAGVSGKTDPVIMTQSTFCSYQERYLITVNGLMRSQVLKYLLIFGLLVSVALNLYLFQQGEAWKEAFYDQSSTTADIEFIFRRSGADTS